MQQFGVVMETVGDKAVVRFTRTKACLRCGACMSLGENEAQIELPNTLQAHVGDNVSVELHEKGLLRASLLAYVLPLCALLLGVLLGTRWSDIAGLILGLLFAGLSYALLRRLEPRFARMEVFRPRMISIEPNQDFEGGNEHVQ